MNFRNFHFFFFHLFLFFFPPDLAGIFGRKKALGMAFIVILLFIFLNFSLVGLTKIIRILEVALLGFYVAKNFNKEKVAWRGK